MREALFTIHSRPDGSLVAENAAMGLVVCAMDRESLQEEARDALIRAVGPAHVSYRVRCRMDSSGSGSPTSMRKQERNQQAIEIC
jgi:hypothetical protein